MPQFGVTLHMIHRAVALSTITSTDQEGFLVLSGPSGQRAFPLRLVGGQRVQVLAAVNERLNDANGYRPFPT